MGFEDERKFEFYVGEAIKNLHNTEGWSDGKIAFHLRRVAQELSPRKGRIKTIKIPKEAIEQFIKKETTHKPSQENKDD